MSDMATLIVAIRINMPRRSPREGAYIISYPGPLRKGLDMRLIYSIPLRPGSGTLPDS